MNKYDVLTQQRDNHNEGQTVSPPWVQALTQIMIDNANANDYPTLTVDTQTWGSGALAGTYCIKITKVL